MGQKLTNTTAAQMCNCNRWLCLCEWVCECESSESWKPRANGANTYAYASQPRCRRHRPAGVTKTEKQASFKAGHAAREVFTVLKKRRINQEVNKKSYKMVREKYLKNNTLPRFVCQRFWNYLIKVSKSMQWKNSRVQSDF